MENAGLADSFDIDSCGTGRWTHAAVQQCLSPHYCTARFTVCAADHHNSAWSLQVAAPQTGISRAASATMKATTPTRA